MFVFSLKASGLKYFLSAAVCIAVAAAVILLMPDTEHSVSVNGNVSEYEEGKIRFDGIKDLDGVVEFAESLGFCVEKDSVETAEVKISVDYDDIKFYDVQSGNWKLDKNYTVYIGTSSRNIVFKESVDL